MAKLYFYNTKPNFGDLLNPYLLENIFGRIDLEYSRFYNADYFFIGSILEKIVDNNFTFKKQIKKEMSSKLTVYGSGFITEQKTLKEFYNRKLILKALRGKKTLARFEKNLNKTLSIPLGDPGLLTSKIKYDSVKKYKLGIIPHYVDKDNPYLDLFKKNEDFLIINVAEDPEVCIKKILSCEVIFSSAMHGLIVADSFGIPNRRLIFSDLITGGNYKFEDYYSVYKKTTGNSLTALPFDFRRDYFSYDMIDGTKKKYNISRNEIAELQYYLLKANPF